MASYLVLYSTATGNVLGAWARSSADNSATAAADGYLEVDGVRVIEGFGAGEDDGERSDIAAVVLADPTYIDTSARLGTLEVDDPADPADVDRRTDEERDPFYPHYE